MQLRIYNFKNNTMATKNEPTDDFWKLRDTSFYQFSEADWSDFYRRMAPFLQNADPAIREGAVERLAMATMRAEPMEHYPRLIEPSLERLSWLLDRITQAHRKYPDVIPAFLKQLRYHGDDEPFSKPLRTWLHVLKTHPPVDVSTEVIAGTLVLLGDTGTDGETGAENWLALLDDPADYVRACAAKMLGKHCETETNFNTDELLALIKAKEFIRPGIAGPFWSALQFDYNGSTDIREWMMEILEQRQAPEPSGMPFNGIDFYLHELCADSVEMVQRLLKAGHKYLAIETATEISGVIAGMEDVLLLLGDDADPKVARWSWTHLALYYHRLHPKAQNSPDFQFHPQWLPGIDVFVIRQGGEARFREIIVFYPSLEQTFIDDQKAWQVIDRCLPPAVRGEVVRNDLQPPWMPVGPVRLESMLNYQFASGTVVTLEGDPDNSVWNRIEIIGKSQWHCSLVG